MHRDAADALAEDDALAPLVERHGPIRIEPAEDIFERLVVAIVRQQVSMAAADRISERLFDRFEIDPETLRDADPEALRDAGLSEAKAEYVRGVATAFAERGYDRDSFAELSNDEIATELGELRGVGPWTVKMFLIHCLGRPDVFPVEDLGVRKGMAAAVEPDLTRAEMVERATAWQPYRSYAALYLWRAYEG